MLKLHQQCKMSCNVSEICEIGYLAGVATRSATVYFVTVSKLKHQFSLILQKELSQQNVCCNNSLGQLKDTTVQFNREEVSEHSHVVQRFFFFLLGKIALQLIMQRTDTSSGNLKELFDILSNMLHFLLRCFLTLFLCGNYEANSWFSLAQQKRKQQGWLRRFHSSVFVHSFQATKTQHIDL